MKKILISLPGITGRGGLESVIELLVNSSITEEYQFYILIEGLKYTEWLEELPNNVIILNNRGENRFDLIFSHLKVLLFNNFDVVIETANKALVLDYLVRKFKKFKLVSWCHSSIKANDINDINPQNIKLADYHLAISSGIMNELKELGISEDKIFLIYNPVKKNPRLLNHKSDDQILKLVFVGRLSPQKKLDELFKTLDLGGVNYHLDIYGDGPEYQYLNQLAEELDLNVDWRGWFDDPWKEIANNGIDYLVLSSKFEGFGMVLAEAISRGIPVISSNCPVGPADIIKPDINGFLYTPGDREELHNILLKSYRKKDTWDYDKLSHSIDNLYVDKYLERFSKFLKKIC